MTDARPDRRHLEAAGGPARGGDAARVRSVGPRPLRLTGPRQPARRPLRWPRRPLGFAGLLAVALGLLTSATSSPPAQGVPRRARSPRPASTAPLLGPDGRDTVPRRDDGLMLSTDDVLAIPPCSPTRDVVAAHAWTGARGPRRRSRRRARRRPPRLHVIATSSPTSGPQHVRPRHGDTALTGADDGTVRGASSSSASPPRGPTRRPATRVGGVRASADGGGWRRRHAGRPRRPSRFVALLAWFTVQCHERTWSGLSAPPSSPWACGRWCWPSRLLERGDAPSTPGPRRRT